MQTAKIRLPGLVVEGGTSPPWIVTQAGDTPQALWGRKKLLNLVWGHALKETTLGALEIARLLAPLYRKGRIVAPQPDSPLWELYLERMGQRSRFDTSPTHRRLGRL